MAVHWWGLTVCIRVFAANYMAQAPPYFPGVSRGEVSSECMTFLITLDAL